MEEDPPAGVQHYQRVGDLPWDCQKYWHQRYDIWSLYDEGIWMSDDAWFGITPEPVANQIAEYISQKAPNDKTILIDAFGGAGGNTIAFAKSGRWSKVIAIEKDAATLRCAQHNAQIYGAENIQWWQGDCFEKLAKLDKDLLAQSVIFGSPPWGGTTYRADDIFDLHTMKPYNLKDIYAPMSQLSQDIALYLPRTSDLRQLAKIVPEGKKINVVHYCMHGASKALVAYFGQLAG